MSLAHKSHIFIFTNFFDFKSIEGKRKNVKTNLFHIEKNFYDRLITSSTFFDLESKLFSSDTDNNTYIFYKGLEQKAEERIEEFLLNFKEKYKKDLKDHLRDIFCNSYNIDYLCGIKTYIPTKNDGKNKRILSVLYTGKPVLNLKEKNAKSNIIQTEFSNDYKIYIVVPIEYDSWK